jgi:excisionase family DNA binding protein
MVNPFEILDARLAAIEDLLLDMKRADRPTPAPPPPARIITINEAAALVGLAKATLYKLTSAGKIPHSKRGKKLYFEREALESWLTQDRVQPDSADDHAADTLSASIARRRRR